MNKAELIAKVAENTGLTKKDTEAAIELLTKFVNCELPN